MLKGTPVSAGIGMGGAVVLRQNRIEIVPRAIEDPAAEIERLRNAVARFSAEIDEMSRALRNSIGEEEAGIIAAHGVILRDPELMQEVSVLIRTEMVCAEYAFHKVCDGYITLFSALEDELLSARAADFRDIRQGLINTLMGVSRLDMSAIPQGSVLVAEDITPSQAATLEAGSIAGMITEQGTRFSHIAIIARALGIPTVVSVPDACRRIEDGMQLVVDGENGDVILNPDPAQLAHYTVRRQYKQEAALRLLDYRDRETVTEDGVRINLSANLAVLAELCAIAENNVDGIGLFRTEFLYMDAGRLPTEEEQYQSYRRILQAMGGKPVQIRTLDMGGDKEIPYLRIEREDNPFLGHRGVRFCLSNRDIFRPQIRALLRASAHGNLRILLPMITSIGELRAVREMIRMEKRQLASEGAVFDDGVQVGVMIETPSAALCADALARECDFFNLGTNDLVQYTLAVDRGNKQVADLYTPLHPAVLRLIGMAVAGARAADIPVEVCGESAEDRYMTPLLLGLGVTGLSVPSASILRVRELVALVNLGLWQQRMGEVLHMSTPQEVLAYLERAWRNDHK